ncbi:MAG: RluA family pseudouridine synthase [Myxococcota bacterium]
MIAGSREFEFQVDEALAGVRLDQALVAHEPALSRSRARRLIEEGAITLQGGPTKASHRLRVGERVRARIPPPLAVGLEPEPIPLAIVHEDAQLLVVDKPAGLVVHPGGSHRGATLVRALLHHCRDLSGIGGVLRPGIVHRLDKGTSGLLVIAKCDSAHRALATQFAQHSIDREYLALVRGVPRADAGTVDAPIGRHRTDPKRFTTRARSLRVVRAARTHWRVERRFRELALLRVTLETGRTHQIRVHLASVGLPVAGDPTYGGGRRVSRALGLDRQALHAALLGFEHPATGARLRFHSDLPEDLAQVVARL